VSDPDKELSDLLSDLHNANSEEEEAALGRDRLASLLLHHAPQVLDDVLKLARRDNRMRRCPVGGALLFRLERGHLR
jgi:hypothetical protein